MIRQQPFGNTPVARVLSCAYRTVIAARNTIYDQFPSLSVRVPVPVISVGGVHAGGTGKTPLVAFIARQLQTHGLRVLVASRGYGRRQKRTVVISPMEPARWEEVGDEPAMLRRELPEIWLAIDPRRSRGIQQALKRMEGNPQDIVVVLDDGFQHRRLRRDIDIVCLPPHFQESLVIPAGYLREPLGSLTRADVVCVVGDESEMTQLEKDAIAARRMGARETFVMVRRYGEWVEVRSGCRTSRLPLQRPALVCGIARPERFYRAVTAQGVTPVRTLFLPDHSPLNESELQRIAGNDVDGVIMTAKDAARIESLNLANLPSLWYLTVRLCLADENEIDRFRRIFVPLTHHEKVRL